MKQVISLAIWVVMLCVLVACSAKAPPPPLLNKEGQWTFIEPEQAAEALVLSIKSPEENTLIYVFGPGAVDVLSSGDPVADRAGHKAFLQRYEERHFIEKDGQGRVLLYIGAEEHPFPVPLVLEDGRWKFDTLAGKEEITNRRIGNNELHAISMCKIFVEAQRDYFVMDPNMDGSSAYAKRIISTPGKKDGLFWPRHPGEELSPLGPLVTDAEAQGYSSKQAGKGRPFHGYYFKILTSQGRHACGGKLNYLDKKGRMTKGFAMIAFPARWDASGIMTFMVSKDGVIYQKDLGPMTLKIAENIKTFDPDKSWQRVAD